MWNHLFHRNIISTLLIPLLGFIFMSYGLHHILTQDSSGTAFGVILMLLGAFYLILSFRRVNAAVKNAFQANPNDRMITLTAADKVITITDGASIGTSPFSSFVDSKICKEGLLLYPQKSIFYWIPANAEIEGGNWQGFTELISSQITRKI
jgi:hypothetical protein